MSDSVSLITTAFGEGGVTEMSDETKELYHALAARMSGEGSVAFEEVESEWRPATVRIVQAMTSSKSGKPDTAKMGDLYHKGGLIARPLNVAVVYAWPTRVRFAEDDDGAPSCSSENVDLKGKGEKDKSISIYGDKCAQCPFDAQPFRYGKSTTCNNSMNVLLLPENLEDIYVMQFSRSAWPAGKQLVDLATAKSPPWSRFFAIDTEVVKRKQGGGQYAVPLVSAVDDTVNPVPTHLQQFAHMLCNHFSDYRKDRKTMVIRRAREIDEQMVAMETMNVAKGGGGKQADYSSGM